MMMDSIVRESELTLDGGGRLAALEDGALPLNIEVTVQSQQ